MLIFPAYGQNCHIFSILFIFFVFIRKKIKFILDLSREFGE